MQKIPYMINIPIFLLINLMICQSIGVISITHTDNSNTSRKKNSKKKPSFDITYCFAM